MTIIRHESQWRPEWAARVESIGFNYHSGGQRPTDDEPASYWYEGAYYEFTAAQVDEIEAATEEIHRLCLEAAMYCSMRPELLTKLGIPAAYHGMVADSLGRGDPSLYGRMDFAYDGKSPPKLLEYNADTPTTVIETAVAQWYWLTDTFPESDRPDQFNSLHEKLIDRWRELNRGSLFHFSAAADSLEEFSTVEYLRDCAQQAGLATSFTSLDSIGWNGSNFEDHAGRPIRYWFKLYPWEWMAKDEFGANMPMTADRMGVLEPAWKMILSNKGILPILWELNPKHPNLLPAFWERPRSPGWVMKPTLGREGANISMESENGILATSGVYGDGPFIFQKKADLPVFDGQRIVIGSWLVGDKSAGMIVREDESPIITGNSRIVPHIFR